MNKQPVEHFDVLVIGGGPAGMAAAVSAAENGSRVGIIDDNPGLGGQIWRGPPVTPASPSAEWARKVGVAGVHARCGLRVVHQPEPRTLLAESSQDRYFFTYDKLVLATGAKERFLPFPGWTLPNVMGAGGLQAMVKSGLPIRGKRVVVAGSGPLLVAVAAYLREHGAEIPIICEQASWMSLVRFGASLSKHPAKIIQTYSLKRELGDVRFAANSWPLAAEGERALSGVVISRKGKTEKISCDYLACGFHLLPNTELPAVLGCQIQHGAVWVDNLQQTSVPDILCAGEPTGIGGLELSLVEGRIAGLVASGKEDKAKKLFDQRQKLSKFARSLERAFALRPELRRLPLPETLICRCEDVSYRRLAEHRSWRTAKLYTRCGMGPCQGRICGPVTEFLFRWRPDSVRPPVFPALCESLAALPNPASKQSELTGAQP